MLLQMDDGGNELDQLYTLEARPGATLEPLVVEPGFFHRTPTASRDGRLLAYASNRRNGADWDVHVRELGSGEERTVFAEGGWCEVAGFSPDGAVLAVLKATERTGDNDLYLVDVGDRRLVLGRAARRRLRGRPARPGFRSGDAFLFATSIGRDTVGIARYELAERRWGYVLEERWDLRCAVDESGQNLLVDWNADGYTRVELRDPETLELLREVPLPGRGVAAAYAFSRDGRRLAYHFTSPLVAGDVWVCDTETGESERLTESPSAVDAASSSSRTCTASTRSTASPCPSSSTGRPGRGRSPS